MATESRFDTSQWQQEEASTSALPPDAVSDDDNDDFVDDDDLHEEEVDEEDGGKEKTVQPLTKAELEAYQRKQRKRGIIYISSIPHGMTPPKVRHLLGGFGDIERVYLHDGTAQASSQPGKANKKRHSAHFTEGWVEFSKKRIAKQVAEILNAQPVGKALVAAGAKVPRGSSKDSGGSRRWKDYVWTMKYLPGFKWNMLTEQMAIKANSSGSNSAAAERASRTARLRTELAQSALEQKDYLAKVERARVMREKEAKKTKSAASKADGGSSSQQQAFVTATMGGQRDGQRMRTFKQRAPVLTDVRDQHAKAASGGKRKSDDSGRDGSGSSSKKRKNLGDRSEGTSDAKQKQALDSVLGSIF
ncbi:RNA-binding ATPase activator esf2 [Tilletia horrida]|nr:RNA-binding ATPase activator esf2 [Tilletia horrida]